MRQQGPLPRDPTWLTESAEPPQIGWSFLLMTYGIVLSQFTRYIQTGMYHRDSKARKAIVWAVVSLDSRRVRDSRPDALVRFS